MDIGSISQAIMAIGEEVAKIRQSLDATKPPDKKRPLSGVAASALIRCRGIADQIASLSGEMVGQLHTYEHSIRRGERLASLKSLVRERSQGGEGRKKAKRETADAVAKSRSSYWEDWEEEWDDL